MLKKFIAHSLVFSLVFNNLAFATQSIIELDFKDSQTPQRLHTILPSYKIADVSHVEINTQKRQACVYRSDPTKLPEDVKDPSGVHPEAIKGHPVIVSSHDVHHLPWELEPEKLTLFILNHAVWLSPLGEDGYKLEFKGGLLGGMMKRGGGKKEIIITITPDCNNPALGWSKTAICQKYKLNPPMAPLNTFLAMRHDDFRWMQSFAEEARYQSQMMIYNSQLIAHNAKVDKLLKEENEKLKQAKLLKEKQIKEEQLKKEKLLKEQKAKEDQIKKEIEQKKELEKKENPFFYSEYEKVKHVQKLINTKSWKDVYAYTDKAGITREEVAYVNSIRTKNITFESFMSEVFDDQVLEDSGEKDGKNLVKQVKFSERDPKVILFRKLMESNAVKKGVADFKERVQKALRDQKGQLKKDVKIEPNIKPKGQQVQPKVEIKDQPKPQQPVKKVEEKKKIEVVKTQKIEINKSVKAPGLPTANDGFVAAKNWDGKLVKNPNGKGYGYPDKEGNVWMPTGIGGSQSGTTGVAHGGTHWDVQMKNGKHQNVYPGGKIR